VRAAVVVSDLLLFSKIEAAASAAGASLLRADEPTALPADLDLVLVDWSARHASWTDALAQLDGPRLVLFGPHTDLAAHAAARDAGLGPMWARSKLLAELPTLLGTRQRS
jgi:hypothetical protein